MRMEWFEDHHYVLGILLLVLALRNGWPAIFSEHREVSASLHDFA